MIKDRWFDMSLVIIQLCSSSFNPDINAVCEVVYEFSGMCLSVVCLSTSPAAADEAEVVEVSAAVLHGRRGVA